MERKTYMAPKPTLADVPELRAINTVLRRVMVDRYGGDLHGHPVEIFSVYERTLKEIVRNHPHPGARAMAAQFLRTGKRGGGFLGVGKQVAIPLPLGGAMTLAKACFESAEVLGRAGQYMLDDGLSIHLSVIDVYAVTEDDFRRGLGSVAAA